MTKKNESIGEKKRDNGKIFLRLGRYVLAEWPLFIPAIIFTLVSNQLSLMGPRFSGAAIDAIEAASGVQLSEVFDNVLYMIICYAVSAVLSYVLAVVMVFMSQRIVRKMRSEVFTKLMKLPVGYFDTQKTGDIISRISYDIDTINATLSHDLVQVMTSVYTVIGSLIFMWRISPPMIIIFVLTVPVSILFTRYRSKTVRPLFRARSRKYGELNGYAEEMLSGMRAIRAFGRERVIGGRFDERNRDTMAAYYRAEYQAAMLFPAVNFINNFSISMIAILGGILYMLSVGGRIEEGAIFFITLGGVAQFVQYSRKFAGPINEFANILHEFQSAFSAAERVFRVLDADEEIKDAPDAVSLPSPSGEVALDSITFGYTEERTIIKNLSLNVTRGTTVAIVGPTGAGKTTIINLLMRFYDPNLGEVRMDGIPALNIKRSDLRRAYTMVLQDTWLFYGTVYDNIAYGKEGASRAEVEAAARAARIHSYIETLPDGYDTILSDDGVSISKGQRQLITIARAFLSDAPMLILDEATSNVDSRTEIKIQEAMDELMKNRTCFVIAHRLSTIKDADVILVVNNGEITEKGTHDELLASGGAYAALYNSQFK